MLVQQMISAWLLLFLDTVLQTAMNTATVEALNEHVLQTALLLLCSKKRAYRVLSDSKVYKAVQVPLFT